MLMVEFNLILTKKYWKVFLFQLKNLCNIPLFQNFILVFYKKSYTRATKIEKQLYFCAIHVQNHNQTAATLPFSCEDINKKVYRLVTNCSDNEARKQYLLYYYILLFACFLVDVMEWIKTRYYISKINDFVLSCI